MSVESNPKRVSGQMQLRKARGTRARTRRGRAFVHRDDNALNYHYYRFNSIAAILDTFRRLRGPRDSPGRYSSRALRLAVSIRQTGEISKRARVLCALHTDR